MITTTLNKIKKQIPSDSWKKLLTHLSKSRSDSRPLPLLTVIDAIGLDNTLQCLGALPEHSKEWRLLAVWYARQVQYLMTDKRSAKAIDVAEAYAHGKATRRNLTGAEVAAGRAARDYGDASLTAAAWVARAVTAENAQVAVVAAATWAARAVEAEGGSDKAIKADQEEELRRIVGH